MPYVSHMPRTQGLPSALGWPHHTPYTAPAIAVLAALELANLCSLQGPYDRSATFFGRYDRCWPKAGPKALAVTEQPAAARVKSGL